MKSIFTMFLLPVLIIILVGCANPSPLAQTVKPTNLPTVNMTATATVTKTPPTVTVTATQAKTPVGIIANLTYIEVLGGPEGDLYPPGSPQSPEIAFSGSYTVITEEGKSTSKNVEGTTPFVIAVIGNQISCTFKMKTASSNYLKVKLVKGGATLGEGETTTFNGVVAVSTK